MSGSYIFLIWNILRAISATLNMKILWCWRSVFAVCFSYYCRFWGLQIESFLKYSDTWLLWIVFHFYSENSSLWNNFYYFSPFRVLWRLMLIESPLSRKYGDCFYKVFWKWPVSRYSKKIHVTTLFKNSC